MINNKKKFFKIAIDSPAAAGAGTLAKSLAKHYNLIYLDTGKIFRYVAYLKLRFPKKFNNKFIKSKIKNLKIKDLSNKSLLSDNVAIEASEIAKKISIRKLVHSFQLEIAYYPPKKYNGSVLDGRNITYEILPDAEFKFFITANLKTRAKRRYKELKPINNLITLDEVLKSIKKRDKSDYNRKISPLKKTKDSVLINTTNLSKRACFLKINRKLNT